MLDLMRVLVLLGALTIFVVGILVSCIGFVAGLTEEADRLVIMTYSVSLLALTTGLGLALAWHASAAIQRRPSSLFRPNRVWLLAFLLLSSVGLGHVALSLHLLPLASFPLFHVGATVLPPVLIVVLVARGLGTVTSWRDVTLQLASGAFLATFLSFALEAIAILSILTLTFLGLAMQPGSQELLEKLAVDLSSPTWLQDPTAMLPLLTSPAIMAAAAAFVAGIIPLIEEAVKTVGVGLMAYRRPTLSQAFLWGLAGGAGFALVEGLLSAAVGEGWAPAILLRVGATLLHCFTGALMGLAWYSALAWRRWHYCLGLYAASVGIHGLWNLMTLALAFLSLRTLGSTALDSWTWAGPAAIAAFMLLLLLVLTIALSLAGLTQYIRRHRAEPVAYAASPAGPFAASSPPDAMTDHGQWPSSTAQQNPGSE